MPIVTVELVADADSELEHNLAQSLADEIGRALSSPPGQTWVRLRSLRSDHYAENESVAATAELPVFVTVLKGQAPRGTDLIAEVAALTAAIARVVDRPAASVHIEYAASAAGRVSVGGKLVQ